MATTFKTAKEVYDYNIGQGLSSEEANRASVAFKPPVDPTRSKGIKDAFSTSMKEMGITSASDPRWTAASDALVKKANALGVSNTEYSTAMGEWNDEQIANSKTQREKAAQFNGGEALSKEAISNAQSLTKGWTSDQIAAKAREMGVTPEQLGSAFGGHAGETVSATGYGTEGGLMDAYKGVTWDGSKWVAKPVTGGSTATDTTTTTTEATSATTTPVASGGGTPAAQPVQTYQAAQTVVDPTKTTQGLMNSLLAEDSDYLKRARALSMDKFNERGLGSSSFAQGAGVAAAIDAALGIAAPDAQIYSGTARDNTNALNQAGQFNAGEANKLNLQTQGQAYDSAKTDKLQGFNLQNMSVQQKNDLEKITTTMTAQQSNDLAKMALNQGYDLAKMSTAQLNDLAKMSTAQGYVKEMAGISQAFDITKMDKAAALTLSQMDKQQINAIATMTAAHGFDMQKLSQNQIYAMEQLRQSGQNSIASAGVGASATLQAAALHADANKALNLSNQQFATLTNKSAQASSIMTNLQNTLTGIDQNPNFTDAAAKTAMKENVVTTTRAALSVIQSASTDADLLDIMDQVFG